MKQSLPAESEQQRSQSNHATDDMSHASDQNFVDNRPQAIAQRQLIDMINSNPKMITQRKTAETMHNSPRMVAQREQHRQIHGEPIQKQVELEEKLVQGKIKTVQKGTDDGMPMQRKFDTIQRVEEEDLAQAKFVSGLPLQRAISPRSGEQKSSSRIGVSGLMPPVVIQRKVLTDSNEINTKMGIFNSSDPVKESDTVLSYVGRFKIWLSTTQDSLDPVAEQTLRNSIKIVPTATAVQAVLNLGNTSPPTDSDAGDMDNWIDTNYFFMNFAFEPLTYLTDQASKDLKTIKGTKSDVARLDFDFWVAFDLRINDGIPIKAWPLYLADLRVRKHILTKESQALVKQHIYTGVSDKEKNLGGNIVGAMGSANIRSGNTSDDQFQYPRVPYKNQGVLGGGGGHLNPTYWKKIQYSSFILKDSGVKPSVAVKDAFAGPTRLECLSTIRAVLAKGLLDTFGDDVFDHHFKYKSDNDPGVVIGTNTAPFDRVKALMDTPVINKVDDLIRGDWIYYKNDARYLQKHPDGLWQGENCVYDGNKKWSGFGLNGMTEQHMKTSMEKAFNDDPNARDIQMDPQLASGHPQRKPIATLKNANPIGWVWSSLQRFHLNKFLV